MIQPVWRLQRLSRREKGQTVSSWYRSIVLGMNIGARRIWHWVMTARGFQYLAGRRLSLRSNNRLKALGLLVSLGFICAGLASFSPVAQAQLTNWGGSKTAVQIWRNASFPVEGFQAYTSAFGYRRSATGGRSSEFHYGLDLAAPQGSFIRSWWGGQVVEVTDNTRCGTSIVVQSGDWEHIYCHMQGKVEKIGGQRYLVDRGGSIQIREGQAVQTGARIGRVGMTGRTTGPHLHWGLKHRGSWVDPGLVLRAMQSARPVS